MAEQFMVKYTVKVKGPIERPLSELAIFPSHARKPGTSEGNSTLVPGTYEIKFATKQLDYERIIQRLLTRYPTLIDAKITKATMEERD